MNHNRIDEAFRGQYGNYIMPFFWLRGEEHEVLKTEIQKIHESGIGALCIESRPHQEFCDTGWWNDVGLVLEECKKLGIKVWILDDKLYPSGYANRLVENKYPNLKRWGITERHMDITGKQCKGSVIYDGWKTSAEDELIAILACERSKNAEELTGTVVDITDNLSDGMVYLDLPEGCWRIVYLFKTQSGISKRLQTYCDMMSDESTNAMIEGVYQPHFEHFEQYFGNTLVGFFSDEPNIGNNSAFPGDEEFGVPYCHFPWHAEIAKRLEEQFGANYKTLLPALWFSFGEKTPHIRVAFMNVVTTLYKHNFCDKLGNWCRAHGVEYIGHVIEDANKHTKSGASAGHFFRGLDGQDMAGIDVVLCQIVPGFTEYISAIPASYKIADPEFFHYALAKLGSSHGHIQKRKAGRTMCEIFGAYGWAEGLKMMKWVTDHMLVRGVNHFVPHAFSPKFPDSDCPPHFYAEGHNPQYPYFKLLMEYMNRLSHILNGGVHVASTAILYHAEAEWAGGKYMLLQKPAKVLYDHQIDYDIIPADYLLEASVKDGKLVINEESYPCFIVPQSDCLPIDLIKKLHTFSLEGLSVIYVNSLPLRSTEGIDISQYITESKTLTVVSLHELNNFIIGNGFNDIVLEDENIYLRSYHYCLGNSDCYMLTNEDVHNTIHSNIHFSAYQGGEYAVYDALENTLVKKSGTADSIMLHLEPYQSVIFIFGELPSQTVPAQEKKLITNQIINNEFTVSTKTCEEADYKEYKKLSQFINITGKEELPRFSGNIKYETVLNVEFNPDFSYELDLGTVGEIAELKINGQSAGTKFVPPYRFDITKFIHDGSNQVTVIVTNHLGYKMRDGASRYLLLEQSGLLGPVELVSYQNNT